MSFVSMNSSKMSVQRTNVFGICSSSASSISSSRTFFIIRSRKARPLPLPPSDPSPIRAKFEYWSNLSRWNTATTPWFFILRYATMASMIIWRCTSTSFSFSQVIFFRNSAMGKRARLESQRLTLLWRRWYCRESMGRVMILSCSSFKLCMRATSFIVVGSRNTKSPKPK